MKEQLIDRVRIFVKGGDGGNGCISMHREKFMPNGGPDGGRGGRGGSVVLRVDEGIMDFLPFKYKVHFKANRGKHGRGSNKNGKNGPDFVVKVPRGTLVYDSESGDLLADLVNKGDEFLAARGGGARRERQCRFCELYEKDSPICRKGRAC